MEKLILIIGLLMAPLVGIQAQMQINALNSAITENFDFIGTSTVAWADNSTITGWYFNSEASTTTLTAGTGSSTAGGAYNFGTSGGGDRALGYLGSSANDYTNFGLQLTNNTGVTITELTISYSGELWRSGGAQPGSSNNTFTFAYQLGLNALPSSTSTSGWTQVVGLNYAPSVAVAAGAQSGAATVMSANITGLNIAHGSGITLRWIGNDGSGSDAGLAIDDVSVTAVPEPATWALIGLGLAFTLWNIRRRRGIKG